MLPSKISVNGVEYKNGESGTDIVYSVNNSTYKGLELILNANPTNSDTTVISVTDSAGNPYSSTGGKLIFKDVS